MVNKDNDFYRSLLLRYIDHVGQAEGTSFLSCGYRGFVDFTDEEWEILISLDDEVLAADIANG